MPTKTKCRFTFIGLYSVLLALGASLLSGGEVHLHLANDGETDYRIVRPAESTAVDAYAVEELAEYLRVITGATYPVIDPEDVTAGGRYIFVGLSEPVRQRLSGSPWDNLGSEEHVARSHGDDIFLYGEGIHGNLYAVLFFLEECLGWRWYSVFEPPLLPDSSTVTLPAFNHSNTFSFPIRMTRAISVLRHGMDFYYQQRLNVGFAFQAQRSGATQFADAFDTRLKRSHNIFFFIPPHADSDQAYPWLEGKAYFETNPEYFSLWTDGKRVDNRQLCFSNPNLRQELTANIIKSIHQVDPRAIVSVTAHDTPGPFCYCEGCQALEEKYQSPGGPFYDYLIELCERLAVDYPEIVIHTLAYRRAQTQIPPRLPEGQKLPENLAIDFAPIEDNYFADWTHPDERIQETYADLKAWGKITGKDRLWAWLYPNPWRSGTFVPVGNVDRVITTIRMMHEAGVRGLYANQNARSFTTRSGFSELQDYLRKRLMQDVDADTDTIIEEFTAAFYGDAAPLMRQYIEELEEGRRAMIDLPANVTFRSDRVDSYTFPYLTPENIHRWQTYFDQMEALATDRQLVNVQLARRELDYATLWRWLSLQEEHPEYYQDHEIVVARMLAADRATARPEPAEDSSVVEQRFSRNTQGLHSMMVEDFVRIIETGGQDLPLPPIFDSVDPARIYTFVPHRDRGRPRYLDDPEAARGYAAVVDRPNIPFTFGFFQDNPRNPGARRTIELDEIEPGEYRLYELGSITITHDCRIWFGRSWATKVQLARLFEPGGVDHYDAYASIKFDGPSYGGEGEEDLVLVDRVILVRTSEDQF